MARGIVHRMAERVDGLLLVCPVIEADPDSSVGYKDAWGILDNYPRATFAVLDKAGHNLQIEQPAVFAALVGEWLDRVAAQV